MLAQNWTNESFFDDKEFNFSDAGTYKIMIGFNYSNVIGNSDECIEIYDPVCGCDGITYDNYCVADSSGVASYVAGECCD